MRAQWQMEKEIIQQISHIKEEIEQAKADYEKAERQGDYNKASQLKYGTLVELERKLHSAEAAAGHVCRRIMACWRRK